MSSNIKILIACHKPSELPDNPLFMPVRVGAAMAKDDFGLQRDDDGSGNISDKNPEYCELTAIYWAWKNLDADYYGLFHYRRFYSFSNKRFPVSDDGHMMVRARILSQDVFDKFGLNDEKAMRNIIEANDLIVHESRAVHNLPTPRGLRGKNLYEHYIHHDGTIVRKSDIDEMIDVVREKYPNVYTYFERYMMGDSFLGYNMFIMKKGLFNDMCSFTFGVLREMEVKIDASLPSRSLNGNRIYGYLAEILTSAYIYYIRQSNPDLRVRELQMIYALKTDPIKQIESLKDSVPVVLDATTNKTANLEFYVDTTLHRLTDECSKDSKGKYDIIVAHDQSISKEFLLKYEHYSSKNVSVRLVSYDDWTDVIREVHGRACANLKSVLPWMLPNYNGAVVLSWNVWVHAPLAELWQVKSSGDKSCVYAAQNVLSSGYLREVNSKQRCSILTTLRDRYELSDVDKYFDSSVIVMDFNEIRSSHKMDDILAIGANMKKCAERDVLNVIYNKSVSLIGQKWNYQIAMDDRVNYLGSFFAPIDIYKEWKKIGDNYSIGKFSESMILNPPFVDFAVEFYSAMSEMAWWPLFVARMQPIKTTEPTHIKDRLAPKGTMRRKIAVKILPSNSRRRAAAVSVYRKITGIR